MGRARVLVVEDDPMVRRMVSLALSLEGFSVEAAADGAQALRAAARRRPSLVLLDLSLPVLDGCGFARAFRAGPGAEVPIIVITAADGPRRPPPEIAAAGWLRKPFHLDDLL